MHFLYPSQPLRAREPDEFYAAEISTVRAAGFSASIFSLEDFQSGTFRAVPTLPTVETILYRGWMLSGPDYEALGSAIRRAGARLFTDTSTYLSLHHLPNWYPLISDLTPETRIFPPDVDLAAELRSLNWASYFVKDYVKSLKTSIGSRISTPEEAAIVAAEMRRFRGSIKGGFCVRRGESFLPETEQRYFVVNGVPLASSGSVPSIVFECAKRLRSRFFSVDVVEREDGALRIVEVGDGQVSDLVGWTPEQFAPILNAFSQADGNGLTLRSGKSTP